MTINEIDQEYGARYSADWAVEENPRARASPCQNQYHLKLDMLLPYRRGSP